MKEWIAFLMELRSRILRYLLVLLVVFLPLLLVSKHIYQLFTLPIMRHFAGTGGLIAINIPAPFLVPMKSALFLAIFVTIPYLLYQFWTYVTPALYKQERRMLGTFLLLGSLLFYIGVLFAFFVVLPLVFQFFLYVAPSGVEVRPDISLYFSFVLRMFFAFGFAFELPIVIMLLCWSGISTPEALARKRPYVILGCFVAGMFLTPPDVISQILLAVPLWILFELGIFLARRLKRNKTEIAK